MKIRKRQISVILILIFIILFLNIHFVNAEDELQLVGELIGIDVFSKIATVDVKTEGCQDLKEFKVSDISELDGLEGEKISFFIDSSICKGDGVHTMHKITKISSQRGEME